MLEAIDAAVADRLDITPQDTAIAMADTIASLPVFCDIQTHVVLSLEGDVDIERARRYKTESTAAHDEIVRALDRASTLTTRQLTALIPATLAFAASFWHVAHPTPTLVAFYEQVPDWGHIATDFHHRVDSLLVATARGLALG